MSSSASCGSYWPALLTGLKESRKDKQLFMFALGKKALLARRPSHIHKLRLHLEGQLSGNTEKEKVCKDKAFSQEVRLLACS
eukprot:878666-Pelagomonas_calceolata.AAC.1